MLASPPSGREQKRSHYARSSMPLPGTQRAASSLSSGFSGVTVRRRFRPTRRARSRLQEHSAGRVGVGKGVPHERAHCPPQPGTGLPHPAGVLAGSYRNQPGPVPSTANPKPCGTTGADTGEAPRPDSRRSVDAGRSVALTRGYHEHRNVLGATQV